jgi:hypothetical protein
MTSRNWFAYEFMPAYNPHVVGRAIGILKDYLYGTVTGELVLNALECSGGQHTYSTDCFTFDFDEEHRDDFEELLAPRYLDCLKTAVSQIDQDLRLKYSQDEVLFEHTAEDIQVSRTSRT